MKKIKCYPKKPNSREGSGSQPQQKEKRNKITTAKDIMPNMKKNSLNSIT